MYLFLFPPPQPLCPFNSFGPPRFTPDPANLVSRVSWQSVPWILSLDKRVSVGYLQNSQTHPNARNDLLLTVETLEIASHRKPGLRDLGMLCPQVCVSLKILVCPWSLPVSFAPQLLARLLSSDSSATSDADIWHLA